MPHDGVQPPLAQVSLHQQSPAQAKGAVLRQRQGVPADTSERTNEDETRDAKRGIQSHQQTQAGNRTIQLW